MSPKTTRASFRIAGVVKAMNQARQQLITGLPEAEHETFRGWVEGVVLQVEQICRAQRSTPERLPPPTYRAYHYLRNLSQDLKDGKAGIDKAGNPAATVQKTKVAALHAEKNQPEGKNGAAKGTGNPSKGLRLPGLVADCMLIQDELQRVANLKARPEREVRTITILAAVRATASKTEKACRKENGSPQELPAPSRRAYAWLKFLSEKDNLLLHLAALRTIHDLLEDRSSSVSAFRQALPAPIRWIRVRVDFFNSPVLYRSQVRQDILQITAGEALVAAPAETLAALVCSALYGIAHRRQSAARPGAETHLQMVRRFAASPEFARLQRFMENQASPAPFDPRGRFHNLEEAFQRVNAAYFGGSMERPCLTWNRTLTHRKLGHYDLRSDTVMVALSLDDQKVPALVVDFVVYHELLHRKLGVTVQNGRRYAHTAAFRKEERKFREYQQAQEIIKNLNA